jgi:hypothetical protein
VDRTGRTSLERNEVLEEMRSYFQVLAKENTIVMEEKDSIISDLRDEETEYSTYIEVRKTTDKFKKLNAPGIDGSTTELIQRAGPTLWNRIYRSIRQGWRKKEKMPRDWRTHLILPVHKNTMLPVYKKVSKDKFENQRNFFFHKYIKILSSVLYNGVVGSAYTEVAVIETVVDHRFRTAVLFAVFVFTK